MVAVRRRLTRVVVWALVVGFGLLIWRWNQHTNHRRELLRQIELSIEKSESGESGTKAVVTARNKSSQPIDGNEVAFVARALENGVEVQKVTAVFAGAIPPGERAHVTIPFRGDVDEFDVDLSPVAFFPGSDYFTRLAQPHQVFKQKPAE